MNTHLTLYPQCRCTLQLRSNHLPHGANDCGANNLSRGLWTRRRCEKIKSADRKSMGSDPVRKIFISQGTEAAIQVDR
ncbi:uncharacterized [Tachysurus ichikawai]